MGGRQHNLAGEGAGAGITVRLAMSMWAQDFWGSGQAHPHLSSPWPSLCAIGRILGCTGARACSECEEPLLVNSNIW